MTNNDVLRRLRYAFDFNDDTMMGIFAAADTTVTREQVSNWLKKDDDEAFESIDDVTMATYLNGLINHNRGRREGEQSVPEKRLTNNIIFTKLKIALNLKAEDILRLLSLVDFNLSKHELSAFFRSPGHKHFRKCQDQVMRQFLRGLQLDLRGEETVVSDSVSNSVSDSVSDSVWGRSKT